MNAVIKPQNQPVLTVRQATKQDLDSMVKLLCQLFTIERDFAINPTKQRQGLELLLENERLARLWVAEQGSRVIGMITVQLLVSTAQGGRSALVEDLIVDSCYRNRGIGRQLVESVEQWCAANGVSRLQLLADRFL